MCQQNNTPAVGFDARFNPREACLDGGGTWVESENACYANPLSPESTVPLPPPLIHHTPVEGGLAYTGLAPDAPVVENENGGKQSQVEGRFDLIPPVAMFELAKVMEHGAEKYAPRNWYKIPLESHLNHLAMHLFAYLAGDTQEDHLTHVLARAAMAVEIEKLGRDAAE